MPPALPAEEKLPFMRYSNQKVKNGTESSTKLAIEPVQELGGPWKPN